jgi:hypothetical protein
MTTTTQVKTDVKTIDVIALEWFDKVNGNSYFAGKVTVNYGMPDVREYTMPFQYGYGDSNRQAARDILRENGELPDLKEYTYTDKGCKQRSNGFESLWQYCDRNKIIDRYTKHENCKKRELKNL